MLQIDNVKVTNFISKKIEQIKDSTSSVDKLIFKDALEAYMLALVDVGYIDAHEYLEVLSEFKYL